MSSERQFAVIVRFVPLEGVEISIVENRSGTCVMPVASISYCDPQRRDTQQFAAVRVDREIKINGGLAVTKPKRPTGEKL